MTREGVVYFVSAGLLHPKKQDSSTNRLNRYLNYPLVGLASIASFGRREVRVLHGGYDSPSIAASEVVVDAEASVFLSLPSAYSLGWALQFIRLVRLQRPSMRFVVGGRWVVNGRASWIRERLGDVEVVEGFGESYVRKEFDILEQGVVKPRYELMPDYLIYQPSIEVGRGCGRGCSFCVEGKAQRELLLGGARTVREMARLRSLYLPWRIQPFIQASLFSPSWNWVSDFSVEYQRLRMDVEWRATTRVDAIPRERLEMLAFAGLRVLDLGLESASPSVLTGMAKTSDPPRYLDAADRTLEACSEFGISVKLNLLLFAGETAETLAETHKWLDARRGLFRGVSANPVTLYPSGMNVELPLDWRARGARLARSGQIASEGMAAIDLSPEVSSSSLALSSRLDHDGLKWQRKVLLSWDDVTCRGSYRYRAEEHHPGESA